MKKVAIVAILVVGLSFASLLNRVDQVNNDNLGLGGNPAINAYDKAAAVYGGITLLDNIAQNGVVLAETPAYSGSNKAAPEQMMNNLGINYAYKLSNNQWLGFSYTNDKDVQRSYSAKADANNANKFSLFQTEGTEVIGATYGMDMRNGLVLGAGLGITKYTVRQIIKPNSNLKDGGMKNQDLSNTSAYYNVLTIGGIYDLDSKSKLTFAQQFSAARNMDQTGKNSFDNKVNVQYNEEMPWESTVGYLYKLNKDIELGGTATMVWSKTYTEQKSSNGTYTETDILKREYKVYTLSAEFAGVYPVLANLLNGTKLQGYYQWANEAGIRNQDNVTPDDEGYNLTGMGINAIRAIDNKQTIIAGLARTNMLGTGSAKWMTDETKFYVDYSYAF